MVGHERVGMEKVEQGRGREGRVCERSELWGMRG